MGSQNKPLPNPLSDDELLGVSGGTSIQNERGEEIKEGRFITSKFGNYSSGDMPKYSVGDLVKIKWRIGTEMEILCSGEVTGISEGKAVVFCSANLPTPLRFCPAPTVTCLA